MLPKKFEDRQLRQINRNDKLMNEGIGNAILRLMFGSKFKKIMKDMVKIADEEPEMVAHMDAAYKHADNLIDIWDRHQKKLKDLKKANKNK